MNKELIRELYEKSLVKRDTEWGENVTFFDYEKFAELIMFECIDAVIEGDPSSKMILSPERRAIVDDIKVRLGWSD